MTSVSLVAVASALPEAIVPLSFFGEAAKDRRGMFKAPAMRRHIAPGERASDLIVRAAEKLPVQAKDAGAIFTNVAIPDEAFTGCGAEVAHRLGARPRHVIDLHNTGCVSFIYMLELAQMMIRAGEIDCALIACVQDAAGRVFSQPELRHTAQAPVPGDGCGVGWIAAGEGSAILSVLHVIHGERATDMAATAPDGRKYWQPGTSPISIDFSEQKVASIISRGNAIVPEVVNAACDRAGVKVADLKLLITNQPNPIFLRNWREALQLPREKHPDTFDVLGNLFGAAIPINLEAAQGKLSPGDLVALGGFSHAGDYAAAAVVRYGSGLPPVTPRTSPTT